MSVCVYVCVCVWIGGHIYSSRCCMLGYLEGSCCDKKLSKNKSRILVYTNTNMPFPVGFAVADIYLEGRHVL